MATAPAIACSRAARRACAAANSTLIPASVPMRIDRRRAKANLVPLRTRPLKVPAMSVGASAIGTAAISAIAIGAVAIGAIAIARLAIGRMSVNKARFKSVEIDDLTVKRLRVLEKEGG